jgi:hypothetical protein
MMIQMVQIKLVRGALAMYFSEPLNLNTYKDYMVQASEMAKPYLRQGWHLVHAMVIDNNF